MTTQEKEKMFLSAVTGEVHFSELYTRETRQASIPRDYKWVEAIRIDLKKRGFLMVPLGRKYLIITPKGEKYLEELKILYKS